MHSRRSLLTLHKTDTAFPCSNASTRLDARCLRAQLLPPRARCARGIDRRRGGVVVGRCDLSAVPKARRCEHILRNVMRYAIILRQHIDISSSNTNISIDTKTELTGTINRQRWSS